MLEQSPNWNRRNRHHTHGHNGQKEEFTIMYTVWNLHTTADWLTDWQYDCYSQCNNNQPSARMYHRVTVVGCVCVCVCVWFNFSKQWQLGQDDLQIASMLQSFDLKRAVFRKIASSQSYGIRVARIGAPVGHFACPRRRLSVYSFMWCYSQPRGVFVTGFAIVFGATLYSAPAYLQHWTLTSAIYVQSFTWRKVWSYITSR